MILWLERVSRPTAESAPIVASTGPDMIAERIAVHRFDPSGQRQYDLSASAMRHFPSDGHTDLDEPELRFYGTERTTHASARTVFGEQGRQHRPPQRQCARGPRGRRRKTCGGDFEPKCSLSRPDAQRVESAAPVTYTEGFSTVKAATLTADTLHGNSNSVAASRPPLAR